MPRLLFLLILVLCPGLSAQLFRGQPEGFVEREWEVDGVKRTALVHIPANAKGPLPVVFCFHGHMGRSAQAIRSWGFDKAWPEAIQVYPQGLPTVTPLVDKEGRFPGWQAAVGTNGDRDIKLFDAMLATLRKEQKVDDRRIYVTGHSNGAAFSYILWQARGDQLAAIGPVAGVISKPLKDFKPLPVLHVAGEKDPIVKYSWQELTFTAVRGINDCAKEGKAWGQAGPLTATVYDSPKHAPLVTAIHAGGHEYPKGAAEMIARFFKENPKP